MDFPHLCSVLRRAAWWILPLVAVVMLGTWLYARRLPKVYVATTKIMAPQRGGPQLSDGRGDSLLSLAAAALGSQPVGTPALYLAYLESRAMAEAVAGEIKQRPGLWAPAGMIQATVDGAEFRLNKAGTLIEVRVQAPEPGLAALAANLYPEQLDWVLRRTVAVESGLQRRFLEARLVEAQRAPLRKSRGDFDLTPQEAMVQALSIQVEQARIAEARDLPTVQVLDRATVPRWPIGPNVRRIVQYAGLLALVVGCLAAIGVDAIQRRRRIVMSRREFEEAWAEHMAEIGKRKP